MNSHISVSNTWDVWPPWMWRVTRMSFQLGFATIPKQTQLRSVDIISPRLKNGETRVGIPEWHLLLMMYCLLGSHDRLKSWQMPNCWKMAEKNLGAGLIPKSFVFIRSKSSAGELMRRNKVVRFR